MDKLLAAASIICITIVLLGVNRGFDISDEGLYVLLADPLQQNMAGIFNYDLFFKLLYRIIGYSFSLVELRIFRLLSYLAAAWALAGFWKNISGESTIRTEIFWIACLGLFAGYAFLPPTLSYNSLTVVIICFWLFLVSRKQMSLKSIALMGLALSFLVYVKVSLALILYPLTFAILLKGKKAKPVQLLGTLVPIILLELAFQIVLNENVITRLQEGIPLNSSRNGYQLKMMILSIGIGGFWLTLAGLIGFALGYLQRTKNSFLTAAKIIAGYGFAFICYITHITDEWNHLVLVFSAALFGFFFGWGEFKLLMTNLWILLLLALPFLLHFGSNVYWLRIGVHYWVFWILAFRWMLKFTYWEMNLGLAIFAVLLVFNGIWAHPFGQDKPLWAEKTELKIGERQTLYLDPELAKISLELNKFKGEKGENKLLTAYRSPGLAWLSGSQIPFSPGIWDKNQLEYFLENKPERMIYNNLYPLPQNWRFAHQQDLGIFQGDTLLLLWD